MTYKGLRGLNVAFLINDHMNPHGATKPLPLSDQRILRWYLLNNYNWLDEVPFGRRHSFRAVDPDPEGRCTTTDKAKTSVLINKIVSP